MPPGELYRRGVWAIGAGYGWAVLQFKPGLLVDEALCDESAARRPDAPDPFLHRSVLDGRWPAMEASFKTLSSRAEEESRIVAHWLGHLERCLAPHGPAIFAEALASAGISRQALSQGKNLRPEQLDPAMRSARRHVPEITLRVMAALRPLDMGLMGFAAVSRNCVGKAMEIITPTTT